MPRLSIVEPEEYTADQARVAATIKAGPRGHAGGLMGLWLHHPALAERMQAVGEYLRFGGRLPGHLTELIILMVAREWRCIHEWSVHAPLAVQKGLDPTIVEAVRCGGKPAFSDPDGALVHAYVAALLRDRRVPTEVFERYRARFGSAGVIETAGLIGHYIVGAATLNAVEYVSSPDVSVSFD